jgi:anti-sigma factor RsiW
MNCRDAEPLLHARLDDELDVAGAIDVDRHFSECRACAAQYAALRNLKQEIAAAQPAYALPPRLERKLSSRFTSQGPLLARLWSRPWPGAIALAGTAACMATLVILLPMMRTTNGTSVIATEILDNHLRALQPGHLFDVESSDQHTVKPWFQGKTDFSPPVPDLTNDGFTLVGGRFEVIHQQPAAAIVYKRRQHVISLYVSPSPGEETKPAIQNLGGYHLLHWSRDNLSYWAVSDVAEADLRDFSSLIDQVKGNSR